MLLHLNFDDSVFHHIRQDHGPLKYLGSPRDSSGEGDGTPLQYSCLETPMDGRAWWASVYGVGRTESDTTEQLPFHFSLSHIGEGNGNPLQCSCLENPRDGGTWWAAIYGVAQSRTQLKRLSSSSSSRDSSLIHKQAQLSGAAYSHRLLLGSTILAGALPVGECCLLKCS